jgi:hypothetical protein
MKELDEDTHFPTPKFESEAAYLEWCSDMCQKIKNNCIAMNNDGITKVIQEIDSKLYLTNHQDLY